MEVVLATRSATESPPPRRIDNKSFGTVGTLDGRVGWRNRLRRGDGEGGFGAKRLCRFFPLTKWRVYYSYVEPRLSPVTFDHDFSARRGEMNASNHGEGTSLMPNQCTRSTEGLICSSALGWTGLRRWFSARIRRAVSGRLCRFAG